MHCPRHQQYTPTYELLIVHKIRAGTSNNPLPSKTPSSLHSCAQGDDAPSLWHCFTPSLPLQACPNSGIFPAIRSFWINQAHLYLLYLLHIIEQNRCDTHVLIKITKSCANLNAFISVAEPSFCCEIFGSKTQHGAQFQTRLQRSASSHLRSVGNP